MTGLQECGPAPPRAPTSASKARERTVHALEYYNNRVHKAWANLGGLSLTTTRSSFKDLHQNSNLRRQFSTADTLCRSNSSLELLNLNTRPSSSSSPTLRREYGSYGSIDVIDRFTHLPLPHTPKNEFFEMLQDYRPAALASTDQRSPGPSEYLRGKVDESYLEETASNSHTSSLTQTHLQPHPQSPKLRSKIRFWSATGLQNNPLKNQRQAMDDSAVSTSSVGGVSAEAEEITRRRAFAHYDCQSMRANLFGLVRVRKNLLSKRRNTTTGASAASMLIRASTPDGDTNDDDEGDGQNNDLVQSCPFFRNEIGGEEERIVSLSRLQHGNNNRKPLHRPPLAYGVAVLEFPIGETHWRHSTCPYQRLPRPIENVDQGALYYRKYFADKDHHNWFGIDEQLGPVAISIRREKVIHSDNQLTTSIMQFQYRLLIRTSELQTLRGAVLEDAIPNIKASSSTKTLNIKEILEYVAPEIQVNCLRLGLQNQQTVDQILKLDEQGLTNNYKVGVMYCKEGQCSEEEMYNNEEGGMAFLEFLETIGKKVKLNGFDKYKAGLDNKTDSTGLYSVYAEYQGCEIMFHVSTMLPFTPNNRQQLLRKRHIGNDIVTIVFQEPGALPFTPKGIRSQFQHVFIVVQAINPCTENTHYKVSVSRSKDVEVFGPPIKEGAIFPKGKAFAEFLLAKIVNAENAAHRSEKFVTMATRTRQEYLKDLVMNHSTSTPVDTGQKFSILRSKKRDKIRPRFIPDACQRGAILWQVLLDDSGLDQQIDCFLGISADTFVLIEEQSKQIVFVTPCKSVLGWSLQANSLRIYHHQGECMTIHMRDNHADRDELMEIMERLKAVTNGTVAQELTICRNIMGQLGFHVQPDGIVTLVENSGQAFQAGLRQNSRLVEICKVAVATLTYDQMVDLLKTSLTVILTVILPLPDGSPRKGCTLQNCKYNEAHYEGDYENVDENKSRKAPQIQQAVSGNHRRIYERSFSPPRSSNSSGYGTGSSSKSSYGQDCRFLVNAEGTVATSENFNEKWFDIHQEFDPPPIPLKQQNHHANRLLVSNNTFPITPKRCNTNLQHQTKTTHNHYKIHHDKIQISNSLPLQHVNYSQPLSASINNCSDMDLSYKLEKNNLAKQRQENDYVVANTPKLADYSTMNLNSNEFCRLNDSLSTDSSMSDRINLIESEEELSNGSEVSPSSRRVLKHHNINQTNYSSRNQSPRSINGEAKLRPGITSRSSNRNSANLCTNFQEELLRLINPDNIEASSLSSTTTLSDNTIQSIKTQSRENLNSTLSMHKVSQPEVIFTMARPATVISNASTASSPLLNEFKSSNDILMKMGSSSTNNGSNYTEDFTKDFPLPIEGDWPSLVESANKLMAQNSSSTEEANSYTGEMGNRSWGDIEATIDASIMTSVSSSTSVPELQSHVADLESKVKSEARQRMSLEDEVRRLKEENRKLRDQAKAAVQELRKFTEWFFKNVKRQ